MIFFWVWLFCFLMSSPLFAFTVQIDLSSQTADGYLHMASVMHDCPSSLSLIDVFGMQQRELFGFRSPNRSLWTIFADCSHVKFWLQKHAECGMHAYPRIILSISIGMISKPVQDFWKASDLILENSILSFSFSFSIIYPLIAKMLHGITSNARSL